MTNIHSIALTERDKEMTKLNTFEDLKGRILTAVAALDNKELWFTLDTGEQYKLYHDRNCCESAYIEDISGDLEDLIDFPILMAEEITSDEHPQGYGVPEDPYWEDCYIWTFYKLATTKGYVTIRWLGFSNGYYSISVDWCGPAPCSKYD